MHIVSFSGGKDSTAMLIRMLELDMQVDEILFADTALELPETYSYIDKIESYIGKKIIRLKKGNWDKWFFGKITRGKLKGKMRGFPLVIYPCWHSREAKFKPLEERCAGHTRYIGYASNERSYQRQGIIKRYLDDNGKKGYRFPLVDWKATEDHCLNYLKRKGLHNPLYDKFRRLGCWCCPKQSKKSLFVLYRDYPKLWERLLWYDSFSRFRPAHSIAELDSEFKKIL